MHKIYIVDTNVLLHDPNALLSFQDNTVIVPIYVIEEVDHFKKQLSELGQNARRASRILDRLRSRGKLADGVPTPDGGTLRVVLDYDRPTWQRGDASASVDNTLLALAVRLTREDPARPVVLVTKDTNLRIKADALGVRSEDYTTDRIADDGLYSGRRTVPSSPDTIRRFKQSGHLDLAEPLRPNEYVHLEDDTGGRLSALGRYDAGRGAVLALGDLPETVWGLRPRNKEQYYALDALLNPEVQLVTLLGKAGSGKTLLALAAGMQQCQVERRYTGVLVSRPIMPMGKDVGFLPGSIDEKLEPWMQPVFDNLDLLEEMRSPDDRGGRGRRWLESGKVAIEPLTYIRGRSIPRQLIVVDEAQNLTPLEVKTIITRVGEGTKIVLTGDLSQIDNPYVDAASNGFSHVVDRFKDESLSAHVELTRGERSPLAELAANVL